MTERKSGPPHDLINGSEHFWLWDWKPVACEVVDGGWKVPGFHAARSTAEMQAEGWWYVGPSPTRAEAAASVADARRFRWLMNCHSYSMRVLPPYKFAHGINWSVGGQEDDIRAEIDAAMKERGDD